MDPIGLAGGANVFGFAAGDPANFRLMLAVQNLTEEMLRTQVAGQITAEKLIDKVRCDLLIIKPAGFKSSVPKRSAGERLKL